MFHSYKWLCMCLLVAGSLSSVAFSAAIGTPDRDEIIYPDDEEHDAAEIELGKVLFFDTRLSKNGSQSCASCHNPELGFSDGLAKGLGSEGNRLGRNTPHLFNLAWSSILMWDGRAATLEEQALGPIKAEAEMNMPIEELLPRLERVAYYRKSVSEIYNADVISAEHIGRAIAAFERTLISDNSPFDQYIAGDKKAMSPEAIRGMRLFEGKAECTQCHDGSNFTDDSFHNLGLGISDEGRGAILNDKTLTGSFKTPGLRNIVFSAPYMHDGSEPTLEAVINLYNRGGGSGDNKSKLLKPLGLSDQDVFDLIAFMGALTDPVVIARPAVPADDSNK
ncbi:hypothetical protein OAV62_00410 [bacterium]|nr:hypothetical protein [bacterium]